MYVSFIKILLFVLIINNSELHEQVLHLIKSFLSFLLELLTKRNLALCGIFETF